MMRRAHVAITPGRDFGRCGRERFVRLSYASSMAQLQEAVERLRACAVTECHRRCTRRVTKR